MCNEASVLFSCGHGVTVLDKCSSATLLRPDTCVLPARTGIRSVGASKPMRWQPSCVVYGPVGTRSRTEACLNCWVKQIGAIEVNDLPKGTDVLPRMGKRLYFPAHSSRRLFTTAENPGVDAKTGKWTPQHLRVDPKKLVDIPESNFARIADERRLQKLQDKQKGTAAPAVASKEQAKSSKPATRPQEKVEAGEKTKK